MVLYFLASFMISSSEIFLRDLDRTSLLSGKSKSSIHPFFLECFHSV